MNDLQKEIPRYTIISLGDIVLSRSLAVKKNLPESGQEEKKRGRKTGMPNKTGYQTLGVFSIETGRILAGGFGGFGQLQGLLAAPAARTPLQSR